MVLNAMIPILLYVSLAGVVPIDGMKTVEVFARCPNAKVPVSKIPGLFTECAGLAQFSCLLLPCGTDNKDWSCRQAGQKCRSGGIGPLPPKIVFETLKVTSPVSTFFNLDVSRVDVDFYLLADGTGSMASSIETVKEQFNEVINQFNENPLVKSVRYGIGMYRDETELDNGFQNLQSLTGDTAAAKSAVSRLSAAGGGDGPEANLVGLYRVATDKSIGWSPQRRKIVLYFGDWVGHDPTCGKYGKLTRDSVTRVLKKNGFTVLGMSLPDLREEFNFDADKATVFRCPAGTARGGPGQATFITRGTDGDLQVVRNPKDLVDRIVNALKKLKSTFVVDASSCKNKLQLSYDPSIPITLEPGRSTLVKQTATVPQGFCDATKSRKFTCQLNYIESGVKRPATIVEVKQVVGCP